MSISHTPTHTLTSLTSDLKVAFYGIGNLELELHIQMTMRQVPVPEEACATLLKRVRLRWELYLE